MANKEVVLSAEERLNQESLTPIQIQLVLERAFAAGKRGLRTIPICLCGNPGIGKSQIVYEIAHKLGAEVYEIRVATAVDSSDFTGLPVIDKRSDANGMMYDARTLYSRPELLPFMRKDEDGKFITDNKLRVVFFDEVNRGADPSITNAIFQLLTEYKLGTHQLYPNTVIVLAINPENTGYMVNEMCPALVNRMAFLYIKPDLQQWLDYARTKNIDNNILAFVESFPQHFSQSGVSDTEDADKRFCTPRAWFNVNNMLTAMNFDWADSNDITIATKLLSGIIGFAAATSFVNFCKTQVEDRIISGDKVINAYNTDSSIKAKIVAVGPHGRVYTSDKAIQTANNALEQLVNTLDRNATVQQVKNFFTFLSDLDPEVTASIVNSMTKNYDDWFSWLVQNLIINDRDLSDLWLKIKSMGTNMGLGSQKTLGR